jgi:transcription termination/antitermination protein NusA
MDIKNFKSAISQIAEEKGISPEKILESIESAIAAAYKKDYGEKGQIIKARISDGENLKFWQVKIVVSEDMLYSEQELEELKDKKRIEVGEAKGEEEKIRFNPEKHILLEEAKKIKPDIKPGDELKISLETQKDYGRIAAQTAKQVILQKIREAERETIFEEYKSKEGEIISGIIQRVDNSNIYIDIGKILGIMPKEEQVRGEFYRQGQRIKTYVLKVENTSKGPMVFLSRAYPKIISKLFELEVPEISQELIKIKSIAREAGSRSKISLESKEESIDPIGSAVGQRGTRVMAVINELGGEKIDIIEYSENPEEYIANALSPAKITKVQITEKNKAVCVVAEDQLSLAIGRNGQNVRLAAKLTGWKIDVKSLESEEVVTGEPEDLEKSKKAEETTQATGTKIDKKEKEKTKQKNKTTNKKSVKKSVKSADSK